MMISCEALMAYLEGVPFPASKEELVTFLQERAAPAEAVWMMERIPGRIFRFATDVENTVRLAHTLQLDQPWEGHKESGSSSRIGPAGTAEAEQDQAGLEKHWADDRLALAVRKRLHCCRSINPCLIQARVEGTVVTLEGRVTDVPQGLLAAKIAQGVPGVRWVINNLEVAT